MSVNKVWSRFTVNKSDGTVLKLRIEDETKERRPETMEFLRKNFVCNEPFHVGAGINRNEGALQECMKILEEFLKDPKIHIVVCCEDIDEVSPIIGYSGMYLIAKGEKRFENIINMVKTPEMTKMFEIITTLEGLCNEMEKLGLNKYYSGIGITVDPRYRKMGIANEFVRLRTEICKEHGAEAAGATMTAIGTQKAAEKYGWKTVYEINFEEFGKMCGVEFVDVPVMCKKMVARV